MYSIRILRRGINSRFYQMNSETELVGKDVEISDGNQTSQGEVKEVSSNADKTTLTLDNGDQVDLKPSETQDLMTQGQAVSEPDDNGATATVHTNSDEPKDFQVSRDVTDADGNTNCVTTKVSANSEADAIKTVSMLDSRRRRNSRNYHAWLINSDVAKADAGDDDNFVVADPDVKDPNVQAEVKPQEDIDPGDTIIAKGTQDEMESVVNAVNSRKFTILNSRMYNSDADPEETHAVVDPDVKDPTVEPEVKPVTDIDPGDTVIAKGTEDEMNSVAKVVNSRKQQLLNSDTYYIARRVTANGRTVQKVAEVTAPDVAAAVKAVQSKDLSNDVKAEDYKVVNPDPDAEAELAKAKPQINSDVEVPEGQEVDGDKVPDDTESDKGTDKGTDGGKVEDPNKDEGDDTRSENSRKGVADFVQRMYGVKLG